MAEWNQKGIPQKGWNCINVIDLAEDAESDDDIPYEQCEMCGNEKIRYAHVMLHPEFPRELHVGCVCAEKMSNDYVNPRKFEAALKNARIRRSKPNDYWLWVAFDYYTTCCEQKEGFCYVTHSSR